MSAVLDTLLWAAVDVVEYQAGRCVDVVERNRLTGDYRVTTGVYRDD